MGKTREYGSLAALLPLGRKLLLENIIAGALNLPSARAHRRSLSNARIKPFRCRLIRHTSQFVSKGIFGLWRLPYGSTRFLVRWRLLIWFTLAAASGSVKIPRIDQLGLIRVWPIG